MKLKSSTRFIPLISTIAILALLNIANQKEYTKLRFLIWNTPSLSLGTYLSISTGTGFLLSFILTQNLANVKQTKQKKLDYRFLDNDKDKDKDNDNESNQVRDSINQIYYENILIERDIKEPLPTINANFRVIGKTNRMNLSKDNFDNGEYDSDIYSDEPNKEYNDEDFLTKDSKEVNTLLSDWNDDSYTKW